MIMCPVFFMLRKGFKSVWDLGFPSQQLGWYVSFFSDQTIFNLPTRIINGQRFWQFSENVGLTLQNVDAKRLTRVSAMNHYCRNIQGESKVWIHPVEFIMNCKDRNIKLRTPF